MTDAELAELCAEVYVPPATVQIGSDLAVSVYDRPDETVVAFRGTADAPGWFRDVDAIPKQHDLLGYCHLGFLTGACSLIQKLAIPQDKAVVLTGHSLGGALAIIVGALRLVVGERVDELVTFGAPRAGYSTLMDVWRPRSVRQYRRGNDPVPEVPLALKAIPYCHVREPLISVGASDVLEPWRCHYIRGYVDDLKKLNQGEKL